MASYLYWGCARYFLYEQDASDARFLVGRFSYLSGRLIVLLFVCLHASFISIDLIRGNDVIYDFSRG